MRVARVCTKTFTSACRWEDNAAWALCSMDATRCTQWDVPLVPMVRAAAWNYSSIVINSRQADDAAAMDLWHAHQFCFVVTLGQAMPWLFVGLFLAYLAVSLLRIPLVILAAGIQFMVQAVAFTHAE